MNQQDYEAIITKTIEEKYRDEILNAGWYNRNAEWSERADVALITESDDPLVLIDAIYAPYVHHKGYTGVHAESYTEARERTLGEMNRALGTPGTDNTIQIISHLEFNAVLGRLFRKRPLKCKAEIEAAIAKIDKEIEVTVENGLAAFLNQQKLKKREE